MTTTPASAPLLAYTRLLADGARQRVACAVNSELVRQLQERINSVLFERTAISKKLEETMILSTGKNAQHIELMQLPQSNIRVADNCTQLPPREPCRPHSTCPLSWPGRSY